jgi:hypothetical protein
MPSHCVIGPDQAMAVCYAKNAAVSGQVFEVRPGDSTSSLSARSKPTGGSTCGGVVRGRLLLTTSLGVRGLSAAHAEAVADRVGEDLAG